MRVRYMGGVVNLGDLNVIELERGDDATVVELIELVRRQDTDAARRVNVVSADAFQRIVSRAIGNLRHLTTNGSACAEARDAVKPILHDLERAHQLFVDAIARAEQAAAGE